MRCRLTQTKPTSWFLRARNQKCRSPSLLRRQWWGKTLPLPLPPARTNRQAPWRPRKVREAMLSVQVHCVSLLTKNKSALRAADCNYRNYRLDSKECPAGLPPPNHPPLTLRTISLFIYLVSSFVCFSWNLNCHWKQDLSPFYATEASIDCQHRFSWWWTGVREESCL